MGEVLFVRDYSVRMRTLMSQFVVRSGGNVYFTSGFCLFEEMKF
jgi:hypothetical protein